MDREQNSYIKQLLLNRTESNPTDLSQLIRTELYLQHKVAKEDLYSSLPRRFGHYHISNINAVMTYIRKRSPKSSEQQKWEQFLNLKSPRDILQRLREEEEAKEELRKAKQEKRDPGPMPLDFPGLTTFMKNVFSNNAMSRYLWHFGFELEMIADGIESGSLREDRLDAACRSQDPADWMVVGQLILNDLHLLDLHFLEKRCNDLPYHVQRYSMKESLNMYQGRIFSEIDEGTDWECGPMYQVVGLSFRNDIGQERMKKGEVENCGRN